MKALNFIRPLSLIVFLFVGHMAKAQEKGLLSELENEQIHAKQPKSSRARDGFGIQRITPQVGFSIAGVTGPNTGFKGSTGGFVGGATLDLGNRDFVFETGLLYRQAGASSGTFTLTADYLSVPLLAKFFINGSSAPASFFIRAGVMPSMLVRENVSVKFSGDSYNIRDAQLVNSFDLPGVVGLGSKFSAGSSTEFVISADLMRSLIKVNRGPGTVYHQGIALMSGVAILL